MSTSTTWTKAPFAKQILCKGESLLIDGEVNSVFVSGPKTVNVKDQEDNLPTRFVCVEINLIQAHPRIMRDDGGEINYKANAPGTKKYVEPKLLDANALASKVGGSGTALPDDLLDSQRAKVHPATPNRFELFVDETTSGVKGIVRGARVRFFTLGSSVFVERFENLTGQANLFGTKNEKGGALSSQWTAGVQAKAAGGKMPGEGVEGVADGQCESEHVAVVAR